MRVLIVGGGMAGLAAAIALGRQGHDIEVAELTGRVDGAVIAMTNRAVDALETLGVLDEAAATGFVIGGRDSIYTTVYDGDGNVLPIPPVEPRTDMRLPASISLMRPEFADILTRAARAQGVTIGIGRSVEALDQMEGRVAVTFTDGVTATFDLVVGADGIGSTVRGLCFAGSPEPEYTGHMSFRWVLPDAPAGNAGFYTLPDNSMLITTRLPGDRVYLSTGIDMERRYVAPGEARELLRGVLARYRAPFIQALLARLDDEQTVLMRPYDWLLVPAPWHRGRVVLIGDTVHATTAHLGSGGSIAIEDAVVLAEELGKTNDVPAALAAFSKRRFARAALVVDASVELLRLQQAHAPPADSARLRARAVDALREPY